MKLSQLKTMDGDYLANLFERLSSSSSRPEIVILDPDDNPIKSKTDIHFLFPCDNKEHVDCNFFLWVLSITTAQELFKSIEQIRINNRLTEIDLLDITSDKTFQTLNVIAPSSFGTKEILNLVGEWVFEWVEELKSVPIKFNTLNEYRKIMAIYEEYHLEPESFELFYTDQRAMVTDDFYANRLKVNKSAYKRYMLDQFYKRIQKTDKND